MNPACASQRAYDGGVWNAKQSVLRAPHFEPPPVERVPSRFPSTTSPARSVWTSEKNERPPSGGRLGVEPITMSPVATIATTPGGIFGFAGARLRRRLRLRLLDDLDVGACGGRRPRPAVDEEREHERARGHDCAGTHDQRDHPHDGAA